MSIRAIVFDHDGVIVRLSELIKQGAWGFVANHPDIGDRSIVAEAEQYYARSSGNRFDILRRVFERLDKPASEIPALVRKHADRFNRIVQAGIQSLGITAEDKKALQELALSYVLYINSGTPEKEMNETLDKSGIKTLFKGIYGQEHGKAGNIKRAMKNAGVTISETVFVGDSDWDYEAAKEVGCRFIGIQNLWNEWQDKPFPLAVSLAELPAVIKTLNQG